MPDQVSAVQNAITKGLLAALSSLLPTPIPMQPANPLVRQPRADNNTQCLPALSLLENPCFDVQVAISILKGKSHVAERDRVKAEFERLAKVWRSERRATSSSTALAMHPACQRMIGMGEQVLPFILADLRQGDDHWFRALRAISDENPVRPEIRGNVQEMANPWLDWGRKKGYVS
jgi:hypothetical protein